jgi:hypothetical protein
VSATDLWFGNLTLFQSLPAPETIQADRGGYLEKLAFENGGQAVARSYAHARDFVLSYPWDDAAGTLTADLLNEYRSGEYGVGPFWFADPIAYDTNMLPPHWASPALLERSWPNIGASTPSFAATAANSFRQPLRKGTWSIATAANATPLTDATIPYAIIPIPPTHTLNIGCTGAATGTGVVVVESWANGAAAAGASSALTLLSETGSTRMNATVAGSSYAFAKVFLSRTSSAASTVTPISLLAQLALTGSSPALTGNHVRGKGHTGLEFVDASMAEQYLDASTGRHFKALTVELGEVGAWL